MLILTRRVGESIVVGDDIVLTVFEVRGDAVRVGIEAPRSVQVHRQEVYDELQRLNRESVSPTDDAVDALREAVTEPAEVTAEPPALSVVPDFAEADTGAEFGSHESPVDAVPAVPAEPPVSTEPVSPAEPVPVKVKSVPVRAVKPGPRRGR